MDISADVRSDDDPRWVYDGMTEKQTYAAWPCATCRIRRDEHSDQSVQSMFPELDITDHVFSMREA